MQDIVTLVFCSLDGIEPVDRRIKLTGDVLQSIVQSGYVIISRGKPDGLDVSQDAYDAVIRFFTTPAH